MWLSTFKCKQVRENMLYWEKSKRTNRTMFFQHKSISWVSQGWKEMARVNNLCPSKSHLSANYCQSSPISSRASSLSTQNLCSPKLLCNTTQQGHQQHMERVGAGGNTARPVISEQRHGIMTDSHNAAAFNYCICSNVTLKCVKCKSWNIHIVGMQRVSDKFKVQ